MQVKKNRNEMENLRSWFEVPTIAHYFQIFRRPFGLTEFDIEDLEEALLVDIIGTENAPNSEILTTITSNSFLPELVIRLLKGLYKTNGGLEISLGNYNQCLCELLSSRYGSSKENPVLTSTFQEVSTRTKVEILYDMINWRICIDDDATMSLTRYLHPTEMRVDPVGKDNEGNVFWYFYGSHLYKESSPTNTKYGEDANNFGKTKKNRQPILKDKNVIIIDSDDEEEEKEDIMNCHNFIETDYNNKLSQTSWSLLCYTVDEWESLLKTFKRVKTENEKKLRKNLKDLYEDIPTILKRRSNKLLKRQLAMAPRRISSRISVKMQVIEAEERLREEERILEEERLFLELQQEAEEEEKQIKQLEAERVERLERQYLLAGQRRALRAMSRGDLLVNPEIINTC